MPTITPPPVENEPKLQLVTPPSPEPELFSAEIAMEKRSYNFIPLLLAAALIVLVVGFIYYFVSSAREVLSVSQATTLVTDILEQQGPATTRFSTGTVDPANGQQDPQYKLLSKAGVLIAKPKPKDTVFLNVALTDPGENLLSKIDGVKKVKRQDGGINYTVPLAERKLVSVDKVTLLKPHLAKVDYTWKWVPNRLGQQFDASSELVKSFSTWERSILIKSNGVDFYAAEPTKTSIVLMETDQGIWRPYRE